MAGVHGNTQQWKHIYQSRSPPEYRYFWLADTGAMDGGLSYRANIADVVIVEALGAVSCLIGLVDAKRICSLPIHNHSRFSAVGVQVKVCVGWLG